MSLYVNDKALGRYWGSADQCTLTAWEYYADSPDNAYAITLSWNDGAEVKEIFDTRAEAESLANRIGYR